MGLKGAKPRKLQTKTPKMNDKKVSLGITTKKGLKVK
jgi:hypothetical protein